MNVQSAERILIQVSYFKTILKEFTNCKKVYSLNGRINYLGFLKCEWIVVKQLFGKFRLTHGLFNFYNGFSVSRTMVLFEQENKNSNLHILNVWAKLAVLQQNALKAIVGA